jgi:hypothetical protein
VRGNADESFLGLGRSIVEDLLRSIPFPSDRSKWDISSFTRVIFDSPGSTTFGTSSSNPKDDVSIKTESLLLTHDWTLENFSNYLGTFSSAHNYDEKFGLKEDEGIAKIWSEKFKEKMGLKEGEDKVVKWKVGWPMGVMLFKKKSTV